VPSSSEPVAREASTVLHRRRRPLSAGRRERLRDQARAALVEMIVDRRDLVEAMRCFGDSFDEASFVAAFHRRREDADAAKLVNHCNGR
jgi:hypothetical protein